MNITLPATDRHGASATTDEGTYIVEDVHPSLHGDALENSENSEEDVVKVGDAEVGSDPVLPTGGAV